MTEAKQWADWESEEAVGLIKKWEGCSLKAYKCPAGVLTIGYGHTGPDVKPGKVITQEEAESLLANDLERFAGQMEKLVDVPVTQGQFIALMSFAYNEGTGKFTGSTLRRKLNAKDFEGCSREFARWKYANGVILDGLVKRRMEETSYFLS